MLTVLAVTALALTQAGETISLSTVTGATLAMQCAKEPDTTLKLDPCTSYILGVADALQLSGETCHGESDAWTLQTITIVRRYIRDNPQNWGWSAAGLVREPLMKAFPCPNRR